MMRLAQFGTAAGPLARAAGAGASLAGRLYGDSRVERYGEALGQPLASQFFSRTSGPTFFFNRQARRLYKPEFLEQTVSASPADVIRRLTKNMRQEPLLNQMLYVDTKTSLPDDLLVKADKMTMANSLELRVPLLDHKVLEFAASLAMEHKVRGKETKRVLKAAFAKVLPPGILTRKKAGFPVPYNNWLREKLFADVRDIILSERARARGYFQPEAVSRMLESQKTSGRYPKETFSLLVLELWHRQFVDSPVSRA